MRERERERERGCVKPKEIELQFTVQLWYEDVSAYAIMK